MSSLLNNLLGFDFSEIEKKLNSVKDLAEEKYNNFVDNNIKKYDLSTNEGYEAFINEASELRKSLSESNAPFSDMCLKLLDSLVEKAMVYHADKMNTNKTVETPKVDNTKETIDSLVKSEVERNSNENHGKLNIGPGINIEKDENTIDWPSDKLTSKQKRSIWKLVDEYMDTKVIPYLDEDFDDDLVDDMSSGLFEFAAWILTKEED